MQFPFLCFLFLFFRFPLFSFVFSLFLFFFFFFFLFSFSFFFFFDDLSKVSPGPNAVTKLATCAGEEATWPTENEQRDTSPRDDSLFVSQEGVCDFDSDLRGR